ncbi:MAG: RNA methyltransferase [Chloroflexota bacterium]
MRITSLQNPRIKNVVKLQQSRQRTRQRKFLIEGYRAILHAVERRYPLQELYICPSLFFGKNESALIQRAADAGVAIIEVDESPFRKMAIRQRPEGLLAVAPQLHHLLVDHQPMNDGFYLIAEAIEKPGNLGTILRSADGAGASGVIVSNPGTDLWHPDVVRGSVGAFFAMPLFQSTTKETIAWCCQHGIRTLAATPQAKQLYTDANMIGPIAIAVGTEQYGLSDAWLSQADERIKLPMFGSANSLNVAVAATILLYEVVRQRMER